MVLGVVGGETGCCLVQEIVMQGEEVVLALGRDGL